MRQDTGYIRVPKPSVYAALPFDQRVWMTQQLQKLLEAWAETERP